MIRSVLYVVLLLISVVAADVNVNYFYPDKLEFASKILKQNDGAKTEDGDSDDYFLVLIPYFSTFNNLTQTVQAIAFNQAEIFDLKFLFIRAPPV